VGAALHLVAFSDPLSVQLPRPVSGVVLYWLGQAGFAIRTAERTLLIDPYLSDSLEKKYRGSATPHDRMMPAPIAVDALPPVDLVLVTHQHTDHMDPETLAPLAARQPGVRFVVPAASLEEARRRISVDDLRLVPATPGVPLSPLRGLDIMPIRAAHEVLDPRFLGYALALGGSRIVHSGDTIPFDGQVAELKALNADLALFPVNGRYVELATKGIAGNFSIEEAVATAIAAGIPHLIAHHYGMFAFNTAAPQAIDTLSGQEKRVHMTRARTRIAMALRPRADDGSENTA
jgi:L-ascorbate metabolism protein UlaG (beta-lactamase superfamily)